MRRTVMMATVIGALVASSAAAERDGGRPRCVSLSAEQQTAIRSIRERERPAFQDLRERIGAAALEYRRLADRSDPGAGRALDAVRDLREQFRIRRVALRAEVGRVLTPEQRKQSIECRRERRARRGR